MHLYTGTSILGRLHTNMHLQSIPHHIHTTDRLKKVLDHTHYSFFLSLSLSLFLSLSLSLSPCLSLSLSLSLPHSLSLSLSVSQMNCSRHAMLFITHYPDSPLSPICSPHKSHIWMAG